MTAETHLDTAIAFELRRMRPEDHDALVDMYESFEPKGACLGLPPRDSPERWLGGLAEYPNFLVMAEGRVAGHAVLCIGDDDGEIAVFVHQNYRGRGIGKQLLRQMIDEARTLGLRRVWGMTELDNVPMLRLARSQGFISGTDPREFYLNLRERKPTA